MTDFWATNDVMEALAADLASRETSSRYVTDHYELHTNPARGASRCTPNYPLRCRCGEPQSGVKYVGELFFRDER